MRVSRFSLLLLVPVVAIAQGTATDYKRAEDLNKKYQGLAVDIAEAPHWLPGSARLWYRKSVTGGNVFVLADVATKTKKAGVRSREDCRGAVNGQREDHGDHAAVHDVRLCRQRDRDRLRRRPLDLALHARHVQVRSHGPGAFWRRAGGRGGAASPSADDDSLPNEGPSPEELSFEEETRLLLQQPGGRGGNAQLRDTTRFSPDASMEAVLKNYNIYVRHSGRPAKGR